MTQALPLSSFETFGDLLKHLRRRARLTQKELSIAVGYSEGQISRLEQNQRLPDLATLAALFIPALGLGEAPQVAARLLELAAQARGEAPPAGLTVSRTVTEHVTEAVVETERNSNLPAPLTSFIGRARELAQLRQWLEAGDGRLLTLLGPGGAGKTRLALALAEQAHGGFAHGAWFVDLGEVNEPALVPQAVAAAVGAPDGHQEPTLTVLVRHLRPKQLLLMVDNCEHLAEACAHFLARLLPACPRLTVLATSREALNLPGETAWPVPPLDAVESARLFVARAQAANPSLVLSQAEAAAVERILRRLDGLPLAIELAAGRLRALSPEQIAARLDDALSLLTSRQRGVPLRHQTLEATLDWSYRLLEPAEKRLLNRLAIFAGSFSLEAVGRVAGADSLTTDDPFGRPTTADMLDVLTALVDKSLVVVEASPWAPRYRLLETVRQYARARLGDAGEADVIGARHARFYLALAEAVEPKLFGGERAQGLDQLDEDLPNLRAALEWWRARADAAPALRLSAALIWFWHLRGPFGQWRAQIERTLAPFAAQAFECPPELAAVLGKVVWGAGLFAWGQGDFAAARARFEASIGLLRRGAPSEALAHALSNLGIVTLGEGRVAEAVALTGEAVALARAGGWAWALALLLYNAGAAIDAQGDEAAARQRLEESLARFKAFGDRWGQSVALLYLGVMCGRAGELAAAQERVAEGLAMARSEHDAWGSSSALALLGQIRQRRGDVAGAAGAYAECVSLIVDRVGDIATLSIALHGLGQLAWQRGQAGPAARFFAAAISLLAASGGATPLTLARPDELQRDADAARAALGEAAYAAARRDGEALANAPETWAA